MNRWSSTVHQSTCRDAPAHWLIYAQVKQMQRNPNQVLQQLHKTMDPRMLQQMGGAQNLMNMMKQMSELEAKGGK